jgi:hypothetical protein
MFVLNFNDFLMSFAVWVVLLLCEYKDEFPSAVAATNSLPGSWIIFLIFYILGVSSFDAGLGIPWAGKV